MTLTTPHTAEALADRIFGALTESQYLAAIHIGRELGLYESLRDTGPQTSVELARSTATDERYVREWLEHQAVGDIITVDDASAPATERRYALPDGHAEGLLDHTSPYASGPFAQYAVGLYEPLREVIDAFRTGAGVPYELYENGRIAQAEGNRPMFVHELGSAWIPALPEIDSAFRAHGGRVADIACGGGWSSIEMARAYPKVQVDGFDLDPASIEMADANLRGSGVESRVRFRCVDAAEARSPEGYDLVTIFEAVHDMADPVSVLATARELLAPGGVVLVADEKAGHEFQAPADQLEQLFYGFSVLLCLPTSREESPSAAIGTPMRPHTMQAVGRDAGYASVDVLPIENEIWRFYLLTP